MRDLLTTVGEIIGAASVTIGAGMIETAYGFIVGGALLIAGCVLVAGDA
jgi:hypothetical protein